MYRTVEISETRNVFRFRVELRNIAPLIWREIEVPGSYTFWDLHVAIQDAMGWLDYHLHVFLPVDNQNDDARWEIGIPVDDELVGGRETMAGWEVPVTKHFHKVGDRMVYVYDFGDDWIHDVVLTDVFSCDSDRSVVCAGGKRACPPEDCGGPWGYQTMLEALANPSHDQHDDMKRWIGDSFDSENFDREEVRFDDPKERWNRAFRES